MSLSSINGDFLPNLFFLFEVVCTSTSCPCHYFLFELYVTSILDADVAESPSSDMVYIIWYSSFRLCSATPQCSKKDFPRLDPKDSVASHFNH